MASESNTASLAGWLFADLLLVLSIVFIGAQIDQRVTPEVLADLAESVDQTSTTSTTAVTTSTTTVPVETTTTTTAPEEPDICPGIDPPGEDLKQVVDIYADDDSLMDQINSFLDERIAARLDDRGLSEFVEAGDVSVGFILVYVGPSGPTRDEEVAATRAASAFAIRLTELMPERFGNSDHSAGYTRSLGPTQANVSYFPRVPQLGGTC